MRLTTIFQKRHISAAAHTVGQLRIFALAAICAVLSGCAVDKPLFENGHAVFDSTALKFADIPVGTTSQSAMLSLTNSGPGDLEIQAITVDAPFKVAANACPKTLADGYTCNVRVAFDPSQPGAASGKVTAVTSSGDATVAMTGNGTLLLAATASQAYIRPGQQVQLTATMNGAVTQNVNWTVSSSAGSVTASGMFTAASSLSSQSAVMITASSREFPSASAQESLPVWPALPMLTAATPATVAVGTVTNITITGADLETATTLLVNGAKANFTALSPTTITTQISTTPWQTGPLAIVAQVDGNEGGSSDPLTLSVQLPAVPFDTAVRFLGQAGFGATQAGVAEVQQLGLSAWIDAQLHSPLFDYTTPSGSSSGQWYRNTQNLSTVLRQRVSLALSHIFVTGNNASCYWRDCGPLWESMIEKDAFGTARTLLGDVTVSQIMGAFLDNTYNSGTDGAVPNQNFAREIMQLMSIGPNTLNADGSMALDTNGQPIPSYSQDNIVAMSYALSGWVNPGPCCYTAANWSAPMQMKEDWHGQNAKAILPGVTLPPGQGGVSDMNAVLDALNQHANTGPFLSSRLIQALVKSNPSPAYVSRVSSVFADDGNGIRGNLGAVVKAILLDPEARLGDDPTAVDPTGGHLMEPILYLSSVMNTSGGVFTDDQVQSQDVLIGEQHYDEPSVFSYFNASHQLADGTPAPEEQLLNSSNVVASMALLYNTFHPTSSDFGLPMVLSNSPFWNCASTGELLDKVNHYLFHGTMSTMDQSTLSAYIANQQWTSINDLLPDVIFLAVTSTSYKVIR